MPKYVGMSRRTLTKEAVAEPGAEALVEMEDNSKLGETSSMGSVVNLCPDEEGTSMGRQEAEEGGEEPTRLVDEGELVGPQGTSGGGELPVEGTDTELRSSRSVTDTESSPGLENGWRGSE